MIYGVIPIICLFNHHNPLYCNTIMKNCRFYVQSFQIHLGLCADMLFLNISFHANNLLGSFYSYHGLFSYELKAWKL